MKKGQMEILGLAIVVVIVLIATMFVIQFMLLKKPTDIRKSFVSSTLTANTLSTFLDTTAADCNEASMTSLIQDCAQGSGLVCGDGRSSCEYVQNAADVIFSSTLGSWNIQYYFQIYTVPERPIAELGEKCVGEKRFRQEPLPSNVGTILVELELC